MKLSDLINEDAVGTSTAGVNQGPSITPPIKGVQRRYGGDVMTKHSPQTPLYTKDEIKNALKEMVTSSALEFIGLFKNNDNKAKGK